MKGGPRLDPRILLLYGLSGAGALMAEAIWQRWLRVLLGGSAPAASATLVAFFAGSALGAAWAGRRSGGFARPLTAYGRLEIAAALGTLAAPGILWLGEAALLPLYDDLRETPALLTTLRFALALTATLPASFCFGATLPTLATAVIGAPGDLGLRGSALYAVNTAGAAVGTALAIFVLPAALGIQVTYGLAVSLLAGVGVAAILLGRGWQPPAPPVADAAPPQAAKAAPPQAAKAAPPPSPRLPDADRTGRKKKRKDKRRRRGKAAETPALPSPRFAPREVGRRGVLALGAVSGFGALALQVLLIQSFSQVLNQSIYAFGAVLLCLLATIAIGAALVSLAERMDVGGTLRDPRTSIGFALTGAAVTAAAFPKWLETATDGLAYVGAAAPGLAYVGAAVGVVVRTAGPLLLAASLVLPLCMLLAARAAARTDSAAPAGGILGPLVVANTLGAVAGAILAPFLLMPRFGLWGAFVVVSLVYALAAVAVPEVTPRRRAWRDGALAVGWIVIILQASPLSVPATRLAEGERLIALDVTPAAVVAVVERQGERLIRIDNHYALGGTAEQVHQARQAHLPLVLAPHAKRVAYIGSATGISAGAVLDHPVERLHVVELVPGVAAAAERHFAAANRGVYTDARSHVVLDDARNFVRSTSLDFDLVVADLFVPWRSGTGALYTREHFEAVRERLAPGGVFCQWLPLYQLSGEELRAVTASFLDVFPTAALFRGDFYGRFPIAALVGFRDQPASVAAIEAAASRLSHAGVSDRWVTDPAGVFALYVGPLAPLRESLADVARNRDDRPVVELAAARGHAGGTVGKVAPATGLEWMQLSDEVQTSAARAGASAVLFPGLGSEARRAIAGGRALQEAGARYVAGQTRAAAEAFTRAAHLLPARLVAEAPADPTAAELWADE